MNNITNYNRISHAISVFLICLILLGFISLIRPTEGFSARSVVLYSSNKAEAIDLAIKLFKKKHPDISVSVVRAGTGELMKKMDAEKGNPQGDVFWSGAFGVLANYKENFEPYISPEAKGIPAEFLDPGNRWSGTNIHVMVIMYNSNLVDKKDLPKKWSDLFDPKWKDKVIMGDPARSSSSYMQLYGIYKLHGLTGLEKFVRVVRDLPSSSMPYTSVAMGEYPLSVTMEYASYAYIAGGQKEIGLIYPEEGTFVTPEGVVLIKGCKHPTEGKLLYDFFCSKEAQEAIFREEFRRPARKDIAIEKLAKIPSLSSIKYIEIDQELAGMEYLSLIKQWEEMKKRLRR